MFRVHFTPTLIALTLRELLKRARCTYVTTEPDKWSFPKRFPIILLSFSVAPPRRRGRPAQASNAEG